MPPRSCSYHHACSLTMFSHCSVRQRWNWIPEQKTEAKVRVWVCEGERVERNDCVWAGLKVMFFCHIPHFSLFLFLPLPSPPSPSLSHLPSLLLISLLPPSSFFPALHRPSSPRRLVQPSWSLSLVGWPTQRWEQPTKLPNLPHTKSSSVSSCSNKTVTSYCW